MKKLTVFFLAIFAMFIFATASFAATVSFTGELNVGYSIEDGLQGPTTLNGKPTDVKVSANVKATDQISATVLFRAQNYSLGTDTNGSSYGEYVDQAYLNFNTDFAAFRAGRFGVNVKDSVDILSGILYNSDYKDGFGVQATFPVVSGLTAKVYASAPQSTGPTMNPDDVSPILDKNNKTVGNYGVSLAYTGSNFGGSINAFSIAQDGYFKWQEGWGSKVGANDKGTALLDSIFAANVYFMPVTSTKIYLHYGQSHANWKTGSDATVTQTGSDDLRSTIVGISWDDKDIPVYVRAEYDFNKGVSNAGSLNPLGFRIGYKFGGGVSLEYDRTQLADDKYDAGASNYNMNYVKFKLVF